MSPASAEACAVLSLSCLEGIKVQLLCVIRGFGAAIVCQKRIWGINWLMSRKQDFILHSLNNVYKV